MRFYGGFFWVAKKSTGKTTSRARPLTDLPKKWWGFGRVQSTFNSSNHFVKVYNMSNHHFWSLGVVFIYIYICLSYCTYTHKCILFHMADGVHWSHNPVKRCLHVSAPLEFATAVESCWPHGINDMEMMRKGDRTDMQMRWTINNENMICKVWIFPMWSVNMRIWSTAMCCHYNRWIVDIVHIWLRPDTTFCVPVSRPLDLSWAVVFCKLSKLWGNHGTPKKWSGHGRSCSQELRKLRCITLHRWGWKDECHLVVEPQRKTLRIDCLWSF